MKAILDMLRAAEAAPEEARHLVDEFARNHAFPIVDGDMATFFFFDRRPLDAIYLVHWVFGLESRQAFKQVPGTEAWTLSLDLPRGSRVEYKLELHRGGQRRWIRDPRNPHHAFDPFGANSVCRMTGYADPPWVELEPHCRQGTIERFHFRSEAWDQDREVGVYLPAEYKPTKRYPLLVCHDGDDYLKYAGIKAVLDNLIHRHEVKPLVVAFTSGVTRNEEYAANPLQARFIAEELLPQVGARFGLREDPRERGLLGASFGGVTSLHTGWTYPGLFGKLMVESGSFVFTDIGRHDRGPLWDPVVAFVNALRQDPARLRARVFMSCGVFESLIYYNRSLAPLLRKSGLEVQLVEALDGHNWINWRDRLREGLSWLFPGHGWMIYD